MDSQWKTTFLGGNTDIQIRYLKIQPHYNQCNILFPACIVLNVTIEYKVFLENAVP